MKYFAPQELMKSATAKRLGINNWTDNSEIWENIHALVDNIADPAREKFCGPLYVNSCYRSKETNIAVGGAPNSQHCRGQAIDLYCSDINRLWKIIGELPYDQRILYRKKNFIHVSYRKDGNNRHQTIYS